MIRVLAIDDEPLALKQLELYIGKVPFLSLVASCKSAAEAREVLEGEAVDAVFTDINMPDLSGMDFIKSLASPPPVVFTTAYPEYAVEGYKVDAVDYLLKPFSLDEFRRAAEKLRTVLAMKEAAAGAASVSAADSDDAIFLKTDYKVVRVELSTIRYVEAMSEYLKIYVTGGRQPIIVLLSMKKLLERLPASQFMRVHRSYIINLQGIREVTKGHVLLEGDVSIPVGDLYKDDFQGYINSKFLGK